MLALTPSARRDLRAKAHRLHPVVSIGQQGLTASVLHEIDVNLLAHELVKVRVFNADRGARQAVLWRICAELEAAPVQHIGKMLIVWRAAPPTPRQLERRRHAPRRGGDAPAVTAAKSSPRARRPREPAARTPARPPAGRGGRGRGGPPAAGGRRRRRGP
jgi:RNA-binding protein